jgi:hypothetical protein
VVVAVRLRGVMCWRSCIVLGGGRSGIIEIETLGMSNGMWVLLRDSLQIGRYAGAENWCLGKMIVCTTTDDFDIYILEILASTSLCFSSQQRRCVWSVKLPFTSTRYGLKLGSACCGESSATSGGEDGESLGTQVLLNT